MSLPVLEAAITAAREGRPAALVTVIRTDDSTPREVGARMLVSGDGAIEGSIGGGHFEAQAIELARKAIADAAPRVADLDLDDLGMECGGRMSIFIEPLAGAPRLLLFGAGHVGEEVAAAAARLGLAVHVIDDRAEWANRERFPAAVQILVAPFDQAVEQLGIRHTDRIVIVTRGHTHDQAVLERCAGKGAAYLGMIGSGRKVALALEQLGQAGMAPETIAEIRAPIGLDLGGRSPAEIAISVVSEMIALQHEREVIYPMSRKPED